MGDRRMLDWLLVPKPDPAMPDKFEALAQYNAEVWRGLVHTPEWSAQMAELQREFDAWRADR